MTCYDKAYLSGSLVQYCRILEDLLTLDGTGKVLVAALAAKARSAVLPPMAEARWRMIRPDANMMSFVHDEN